MSGPPKRSARRLRGSSARPSSLRWAIVAVTTAVVPVAPGLGRERPGGFFQLDSGRLVGHPLRRNPDPPREHHRRRNPSLRPSATAAALARSPDRSCWSLRGSRSRFARFALPLTTSLNSHAAAERSKTEMYVASDWLHLVAGSIWIGGLLQLVLLTPVVLSLTERRASFLAGLIPRFSLVAMGSVAVVVATGRIPVVELPAGRSRPSSIRTGATRWP